MSSSKDSKMQDGTLRILKLMVLHDENRYCFECHQRGPLYVNMTIGSFVCTTCGGALRSYNHRIKAIDIATFSPTEIEFLRKRGNKACRKIYLAGREKTENPSYIKENLAEHLRMKYELKKWYSEPTSEIEKEAIAENQEIMDQAERAKVQKNYSLPGMNASKGLIITPPFQLSPKWNYSMPSNTRLNQASNTGGQSAINKSQTQSIAEKPAKEVFNGFEDETFPASAQTAISGSKTATAAPFDPFNQMAPLQNNQEHDFFTSLPVTQISQQPLYLTPQPIGNTLAPSGLPPTLESRATVQPPSSHDRYAPLAELDTMLKMKTTMKASPRAFPSTAGVVYCPSTATANPSLFKWSALTGAAPLPAVVFGQPGPLTGTPNPSNPFTSTAAAAGFGLPSGTLNPFEQNFTATTTTIPLSSSAAIPFMSPSGTNGHQTGFGGGFPVNPRNPFLPSSQGAVSASNPFTQPFRSDGNSLGKVGPVLPAFPSTATANQYCSGPVVGTGTSAFPLWSSFSSSKANSAPDGNPWTNGTSRAGDTNKF